MKTVSQYLKDAIRVSDHLINDNSYLAHIPSHTTAGAAETLREHLALVFEYFTKLITENGLDETINKLICNLVSELTSSQKKEIEAHIKRFFVDTAVFHDFGKVNENFQADRMQNPIFKKIPTPIKPAHGHSELGAFIYCVYQIEGLKNLTLSDDETNFLATIGFILVNSITLHHSPELTAPITRLSKCVFIRQHLALNKYLDLYGFEKPDLTKWYLENLNQVINTTIFSSSQAFSLYALAKLNFSLLTAADYLATSEYMSAKKTTDLGLINSSLKERIIYAARFSKSYNKKAYELADSNHIVTNPIERNGNNLNVLRQNMAIEVIRTVRQNGHKRFFYLEAPTGGGKTNLSMLAVSEILKIDLDINKVFYVFPFTTLITQTRQAIIETLCLAENEISLLHSKAGFQTTVEDDDYGSKRMDYLNNLFVHYPFCLLTHIRFFDILKTSEKETNYLLHRLANSVVVIDELQSYPPQHWDKILYFIGQFAESFNVRFILMSATLPRIDKLNLPLTNCPNFTDLLPQTRDYFTNENFCSRVKFRFDYRSQKLEIDELVKIVLQKSKDYLNRHPREGIFTIVEFIFKKSATDFCHAMDTDFFDEILVLSGTILESRRKEIINFLKNKDNRNKKVLLITTQVVEAGVDIDMDLGFKNISLIDSDEQLAGRVNRNTLKDTCEVYLFQINQPSHLYKQDERYIITRDNLSIEEHEEILRTKDFQKLYDLVLARIDKLNSINDIQNFTSDYLPEITSLNYPKINSKLKLIDQDNLSVFVPLNLPRQIPSPFGSLEDTFSELELAFLSRFDIETDGNSISGTEVWKVYKSVLFNRTTGFGEQQINKKVISGILSKFTFSVFASRQIKAALERFSFPARDKENGLRGFENYIYLAHHDDCYDYKMGLLEAEFEAFETFIL